MKATQLDTFTRQYLETALWSSTDGDGEPMDAQYGLSDFAPEALEKAAADCDKFRELAEAPMDSAEVGQKEAGHNFWLTRNGHGAGFWDGDYPEPEASELTRIAKGFGSQDVYAGDDGQLYLA